MQLTSLNIGAWTATADEQEIRLTLGGAVLVIPKEQVNDLISLLLMMNPGEQPEFFTLQEGSDRLGRSRTVMRRAVETDRIPALCKAGGTTFILAAAIDHMEPGRPGNPAWLKPESED